MSHPSTDTLDMLEALRRAVANALEKKRRLGQYAVIYRDGRPVYLSATGEISLEPPIEAPLSEASEAAHSAARP